jgi:DNA-binding NtrC family response regulator
MLETVIRESFLERLGHGIRALTRRLTAPPRCYFGHYVNKTVSVIGSAPQIVMVTADLGFYSWVLGAVNASGWRVEWARSMKRAMEMCRSGFAPIVIYDHNLPGVDWRRAVEQLSGAAPHGRVLVAARKIDEDLWRMVLRRRGYDVLARTADRDELKRELHFAWLSLQDCTQFPSAR